MRTTRNSFLRFTGVLLAVSLLAVVPVRAQAASTGGITVSPATATLSLATGQAEQRASFTITNHYTSPITLHFDFSQPVATPGAALSARQQLRIAPDDVTIDGGATATPVMTLTDAAALAPGSQQVNLTITQVTTPGNNVSIVPSIRLPLIVIKQAGAVTSIGAILDKPTSGLQLPTAALFTLHNTGNVVAIPRGFVTVQDPRGREVSRGVINTASAALQPGGQLHASATLTTLTRAWLPGMYRTVLSYGVGGGAAAHTVSARFFYVPLWELLLLLLLATLAYCARQVWVEFGAHRRPPPSKPPAHHKRPLLVGRDI